MLEKGNLWPRECKKNHTQGKGREKGDRIIVWVFFLHRRKKGKKGVDDAAHGVKPTKKKKWGGEIPRFMDVSVGKKGTVPFLIELKSTIRKKKKEDEASISAGLREGEKKSALPTLLERKKGISLCERKGDDRKSICPPRKKIGKGRCNSLMDAGGKKVSKRKEKKENSSPEEGEKKEKKKKLWRYGRSITQWKKQVIKKKRRGGHSSLRGRERGGEGALFPPVTAFSVWEEKSEKASGWKKKSSGSEFYYLLIIFPERKKGSYVQLRRLYRGAGRWPRGGGKVSAYV